MNRKNRLFVFRFSSRVNCNNFQRTFCRFKRYYAKVSKFLIQLNFNSSYNNRVTLVILHVPFFFFSFKTLSITRLAVLFTVWKVKTFSRTSNVLIPFNCLLLKCNDSYCLVKIWFAIRYHFLAYVRVPIAT